MRSQSPIAEAVTIIEQRSTEAGYSGAVTIIEQGSTAAGYSGAVTIIEQRSTAAGYSGTHDWLSRVLYPHASVVIIRRE